MPPIPLQTRTVYALRPSETHTKWYNKMAQTSVMNELRHSHRGGLQYVTEGTIPNIKTKNKMNILQGSTINLLTLTLCCEAAELSVWVPMECRWTTRWLNHSAGGNWAENVARATGGADKPRCLRPLLLNRRDNSDIFSEIQEAKWGNPIRLLGKHTTFAGYNKAYCNSKTNHFSCIFIPIPFFPSFPYPLHPLISFPPFSCIISNPFHLFIWSLLLSHLLTQFHFTKQTHQFTILLLSFRWHNFKHSYHQTNWLTGWLTD